MSKFWIFIIVLIVSTCIFVIVLGYQFEDRSFKGILKSIVGVLGMALLFIAGAIACYLILFIGELIIPFIPVAGIAYAIYSNTKKK